MVTLYEKINRKEMGVFLDALRSLKGSYIDPTSTPPSRDPEDWTEIPAKTSEDFPKQCIAVVQGGSLLLRNNFTREGFRVNILPRGKELREERIRTPEYGVDFDDDNLVLVCRVLSDFLTNIKSRNFSGFSISSKLPLDASKYTRMELEEFDPTDEDLMWLLVIGGNGTIANMGEVRVYKRYNDNWDIYSKGATANFNFISKTSLYPINKLRDSGVVLYMTRLGEKNYRPMRIKLSRLTLNTWIRRMGEVLTNFPRKRLEGFMSYHKLSGANQLCMNQLVTFVMSIYDSTGKMSSNTMIRRVLEGDYSLVNMELLQPSRIKNVLRKIKEDLGEMYPVLVEVIRLIEEIW